MGYEAKVFLNWRLNGWLPGATIYDLDATLALTLLEIAADMPGQTQGAE